MIEQRSGAIVNVSTHAVIGKFRVPYAAAKGGVMGLTTALAKEVGQYGIRVNCIAPNSAAAKDRVTPRSYGVNTESSREYVSTASGGLRLKAELDAMEKYSQDERRIEAPLGRGGLAEEQAAAIAFLASEDASFISGQILPVGGGTPYPF
jgi:NAD(P)-dependent dehydrogenase (short-subunit alcohol dehydrogenase family)